MKSKRNPDIVLTVHMHPSKIPQGKWKKRHVDIFPEVLRDGLRRKRVNDGSGGWMLMSEEMCC
jgi:hypothetical protein